MRNHFARHTASRGRKVPEDRDLEETANRLARFHRMSWREALGRIGSAAVRMHHYRDIRTRMLYDALRRIDCRKDDCENGDD